MVMKNKKLLSGSFVVQNTNLSGKDVFSVQSGQLRLLAKVTHYDPVTEA